jgi:hypothetical protein
MLMTLCRALILLQVLVYTMVLYNERELAVNPVGVVLVTV